MAAHGPNFTWPPPDLIKGEEEFEVEQIIAHQHFGQSKWLQYLIKWKGYPESDNTWESADQVHTPLLIKLYHSTATQTSIKTTAFEQRKGIECPHWSLALLPPQSNAPSLISSPPNCSINSSSTTSTNYPTHTYLTTSGTVNSITAHFTIPTRCPTTPTTMNPQSPHPALLPSKSLTSTMTPFPTTPMKAGPHNCQTPNHPSPQDPSRGFLKATNPSMPWPYGPSRSALSTPSDRGTSSTTHPSTKPIENTAEALPMQMRVTSFFKPITKGVSKPWKAVWRGTRPMMDGSWGSPSLSSMGSVVLHDGSRSLMMVGSPRMPSKTVQTTSPMSKRSMCHLSSELMIPFIPFLPGSDKLLLDPPPSISPSLKLLTTFTTGGFMQMSSNTACLTIRLPTSSSTSTSSNGSSMQSKLPVPLAKDVWRQHASTRWLGRSSAFPIIVRSWSASVDATQAQDVTDGWLRGGRVGIGKWSGHWWSAPLSSPVRFPVRIVARYWLLD